MPDPLQVPYSHFNYNFAHFLWTLDTTSGHVFVLWEKDAKHSLVQLYGVDVIWDSVENCIGGFIVRLLDFELTE